MVTGPTCRQRAHFESSPAECLEVDTQIFLDWINADIAAPALLTDGLGHPRLVPLHPFDDGNGRIACVILRCYRLGRRQSIRE